MTTKLVGLKEFRQHIAQYTKAAKVKNIRFIVLKKNIPVLEIKAIDEEDFMLEKLAADVAKARKEIKKGKIYTQDEVMKKLGML